VPVTLRSRARDNSAPVCLRAPDTVELANHRPYPSCWRPPDHGGYCRSDEYHPILRVVASIRVPGACAESFGSLVSS